jgi:hypothetical protein
MIVAAVAAWAFGLQCLVNLVRIYVAPLIAAGTKHIIRGPHADGLVRLRESGNFNIVAMHCNPINVRAA